MPRLSVVMSIFSEPEEWLRDAVDSIRQQSFSDFEFIVVNDNPERRVNAELLREYCSLDQRIIVITNERNVGLTRSLNAGLEAARGKYIARMDADDVSASDRLEKQYVFMEEHLEYAFCATNAKYFTNKKEASYDQTRFPSEHDELAELALVRNPFVHPSIMIRTSVLKRHDLRYNEEYGSAQDYDLLLRLLRYGKAYVFPETLICYRVSKQSVTRRKRAVQKKIAKEIRKNYFFDRLSEFRIQHRYDHTHEIRRSLRKSVRDKKMLSFMLTAFYETKDRLGLRDMFTLAVDLTIIKGKIVLVLSDQYPSVMHRLFTLADTVKCR